MKFRFSHITSIVFITLVLLAAHRALSSLARPSSKTSAQTHLAARGEYLVKLGGCTDCHTPKLIAESGPTDDPTRRFAGHPEGLVLDAPESSRENSPWGASTAGMTAWTGPWGVSYSTNLTPDEATGIGAWTEEEFIQAMRTGRHRGHGRPILPPMPWQQLAGATTEDLQAIFAYLRSLPSIFNRVPEPQPPASL